MYVPTPPCRYGRLSPTIPGPPPENTGYRNLYILLLVCAFILRFGFVLWKKTYLRAPGSILPFGAEVCSIAAATGITIHALGRRTIGSQIGFFAAWTWALSPICFRWPVSWIWDFIASAFLLSAAFIATLDVEEKNTQKLWLSLGTLWAVIALTNPALLSVMPFTSLYAAFVNHRSFRSWFASAALAGMLFAAAILVYPVRYHFVYLVSKYRHAIEPELLLLSVYFVFVLWSEIRALAHRKA